MTITDRGSGTDLGHIIGWHYHTYFIGYNFARNLQGEGVWKVKIVRFLEVQHLQYDVVFFIMKTVVNVLGWLDYTKSF